MNQVWFARWVSLCVGFLSLSQEILLVRLVGFMYHSTPKALSFVLVFFLRGIALGAYVGKRICASKVNPVVSLAVVLLCAGAFDATVPYAIAPLSKSEVDGEALASLIFIAAALKSVAFPIAHHLGSGDDQSRLGASVSKVYFFNIIGSTLGPLLMGFVLLQYVGLANALLWVALGTLALGLWCASRVWPRRVTSGIAVAALALTPLLVLKQTLIEDIAVITSGPREVVAQVVEDRSGIVHVFRKQTGDATYGNNVYDGRINTDLRINSNGVNRVYILAALHPTPRRVLVIGLSSGAWTSILSRMPGVEHIDVVEINPGYVEVIRRYAVVKAILDDARIAIHFDDGRRWLRRNPDAKYDMIVMNTTWYWRAYSSNLLSVEFLREVKRHMRPGGLVMYNSTGSPDVFHTATKEFSFVRKYENFVYAADHDFLAEVDKNRERIWSFGLPGPAVFDRTAAEDQSAINDMMTYNRFQTVPAVQRSAGRPLEVITDDNLLTEYKYGRSSSFLPGFR